MRTMLREAMALVENDVTTSPRSRPHPVRQLGATTMPRFAYAAIDANGTSVEGVTKADTIGEARAHLLDQNLYPGQDRGEARRALDFELTKEKVKKKELMHFTRQLAVFVKAGIPHHRGDGDHRRRDQDVALQRTISHDGRGPPQRRHPVRTRPASTPRRSRSTTSASSSPAELTGQLDETLENLAGYLERELETRVEGRRRRCRTRASSWCWPCSPSPILAGYVLPQFKPLFEELHADLPFADAQPAVRRHAVQHAVVHPVHRLRRVHRRAMFWMFKTPVGRTVKDQLVLKIPIIRGIVEYSILERFCRILGAMVQAGVPLPDAHETTTEATSNVVFRERLEEAQVEMMEGGGFAKPLAAPSCSPARPEADVQGR